MGKLLIVALLGGLLCACSAGPVRVHDAEVDLEGTRIRVNDGYYDRYYRYEHYDRYDRYGHGGFCPPGQAKKGRC